MHEICHRGSGASGARISASGGWTAAVTIPKVSHPRPFVCYLVSTGTTEWLPANPGNAKQGAWRWNLNEK